MGLPGFLKKLLGRGDEVGSPAAQAAAPGVPGAVDTVGVPMATNPATTPSPVIVTPAAPTVEKTA